MNHDVFSNNSFFLFPVLTSNCSVSVFKVQETFTERFKWHVITILCKVNSLQAATYSYDFNLVVCLVSRLSLAAFWFGQGCRVGRTKAAGRIADFCVVICQENR